MKSSERKEMITPMNTEENVLTQQEIEDKKKLKAIKVTYPILQVGGGVGMSFFSIYSVYFYTNIYMMSAAFSGFLTIVQSVIAWVGSPIMGVIVDKVNFKNSKFYPWLIMGNVGTNLGYIVIFCLPALGSKNPFIALFFACLVALVTPIYTIPSSAVFPLLSTDPLDRQYFAISQKVGRDGSKMIFGYIFPALLVAFGGAMGDKGAYAVCALIAGAFGMAGYIAYALTLKGSYVERKGVEMSRIQKDGKKKSIPISLMLKTVFTNRPLLGMFLMVTIHLGYYFIYTSCAAYMFRYVWNDFAAMGTFMLIFNLTAIVGAMCGPFWRKIFKETKRCFVANIIAHVILLFVLAIFFKQLGMVGFIVVFGISSFFMGMYENFFLPMFAAAADFSAWKSGSRLDGLSMSIYQLSIRFATFISSIIRTWFLVAAGLDAVVKTKVVTVDFISKMTFLYTWVPVLMGLVTLASMVFIFNLNDDKIAKLNADLKVGKSMATSDLKI